MASKPPSKANKLKLRIFADKKSRKRSMDDSDMPQSKRTASKNTTDEDSEFESEGESDEEPDSGDDDEVGPAVEEPTMYVQGEGSGAVNNCENTMWTAASDDEVGEAIEEEVFFVFGEGNGHDCDVGNNDIKTTESAESSTAETQPLPLPPRKPMLFFGQAGCLKLSPMKPAATETTTTASENDSDVDKSENSQESSNENSANDTNTVALDAKIESTQETNENSAIDETDKAIISTNESPAVSVPLQNNVVEKDGQPAPDASIDSANQSEPIQSTSEVATEVNAPSNAADNDSSNKIIELNSSVALETISVQDETETPQTDSKQTSSEVLHEPSDGECMPETPSNPVQNYQEYANNGSENNVIGSSEIVNENNEQNSVSQNDEPTAPVEQSYETSIENEQIHESGSDANEQTQDVLIGHECVDIPSPVEQPQKQEVSSNIENESSSELKTNIPSEQIKIEQNLVEIDSKSQATHEIAPVETQAKSEALQCIPERNIDGVESVSQESNELPIEESTPQPCSEAIENLPHEKPQSPQPEISIQNECSFADVSEPVQSEALPNDSDARYAGQTPVVEDIIVPKKAYVCYPEQEQTTAPAESISVTAPTQVETALPIVERVAEQEPEQTAAIATTSQELVENTQQTSPEATLAPVKEKRKSIDEVEEPLVCKKICGENISIDPNQAASADEIQEQSVNETPVEASLPAIPEVEEQITPESTDLSVSQGTEPELINVLLRDKK